ncbi:MAG: hypothetical protein O3B95_07265 [Chloroflexi bacterium]|nr:hypothetical protein [Chloroflexota bacterium]
MTPQELAKIIHDAPGRGCVVVTGAGIQSISDLFAVPGASRTLLEVLIPYSRASLDEFVGCQADQHVSAEEASLIARSALKRARHLSEAPASDGELLFGVGCTAAVTTDRVRRGEDRAHVAWTNGTEFGVTSIWFDKKRRTRAEEDAVVSAIVLNSIAQAIGIEARLPVMVLTTERLDELD